MDCFLTYLAKIDFGICSHFCLTDKVDNPLLPLFLGKVEAFREIAGKY
jgi:hypothetical protein